MAHLSPVPDDPTDFEAWLQSLPPDQAMLIARQLDEASQTDGDSGLLPLGPETMFRPNQPIDLPEPPPEPVRLSLTISLVDADPAIWREIVVPGNLALDDLHKAIQIVMGWTDCHLHRFWPTSEPCTNYFITDFDSSQGDEGTLESQVRVDQVLRAPQDAIRYEYDFGDSWEHTITLTSIDPGADHTIECTGGAGAGPPEDAGGIESYNQMAAWLRDHQRTTPAGPIDYPQAIASGQLPKTFDPDVFDRTVVSMLLDNLSTRGPWEYLTLSDELMKIVLDLPPAAERTVSAWLLSDVWRPPIYVDQATAAELMRPWLVVLDAIGDGTELTKAGWLKPAVVSQIFTDLGLDQWWIGKGNREDLTPPIADLRDECQSLGLLSKRKGRLQPTARARKLRQDPRELFWHIADRLPLGRGEFDRRCSWLYLVGYVSSSGTDFLDQIVRLMAALGWRTHQGPLNGLDVRHGCRATSSIVARVAHARDGEAGFGPQHGWTPDGDLLARAAVLGRQSY